MAGTLTARGNPLAAPAEQRRALSEPAVPNFAARLSTAGLPPVTALRVDTLQVNVGRVCNQTCRHCHVDAGPDRREAMARDTVDHCLRVLRDFDIPTLDITGGAPELNPHFRELVRGARALERRVIDRCNLTVLEIPAQADLAGFLAAHRVEVVASLPYFEADRTDAQRGDGVFDRSLRGLRRLNALGYGRPDSGLILNLVYNPAGAFLPPDQGDLEVQFRRELRDRWGVEFNRLFALANMPIGRFLEFLRATGNYEGYMTRLANAFNPAAVPGLMCRNLLSVGWDGALYDCDFNQMLDWPLVEGSPAHIRDFDPDRLARRAVAVGNHCFGCTAGGGSSCGGSLT
ncbi:MAG TPA: arsenosugar biosynthesis radical SAM protein ArsS [Elusimicrobiota bacterium]|nr:arsenosugar biosynthesis radical SAM protein ArsS [Elusimicrobiota bacterium]